MFKSLATALLIATSTVQAASTKSSVMTPGLEYRIVHKDSGFCLTFIAEGEKLGTTKSKPPAKFDTIDLKKCVDGQLNQLFKIEYNFSANQFQIYSPEAYQFVQTIYTDKEGELIESDGITMTNDPAESSAFLIPVDKSKSNISADGRDFIISTHEIPELAGYLVSVMDGHLPACWVTRENPYASYANTNNFVFTLFKE